MISVVETSLRGEVTISASTTKLEIIFQSTNTRHTYVEGDIVQITVANEESYRNGGKAAAGMIIGGALTGGVGLVIGAAYGGRKRQEGTYVITMRNSHNIVFKTDDKNVISRIQIIAAKIATNSTFSRNKLSGFRVAIPEGWKQQSEARAKGGASVEQVADRNRTFMDTTKVETDPLMSAILNQAMKQKREQ